MTQPTTRHIQAYSLLDYTKQIEQATSEGYSFRLDTNEGTCQHIGFYFEVMMYKKPWIDYQELDKTLIAEDINIAPKELEDEINKAIGKVQPQKQRGRPSAK